MFLYSHSDRQKSYIIKDLTHLEINVARHILRFCPGVEFYTRLPTTIDVVSGVAQFFYGIKKLRTSITTPIIVSRHIQNPTSSFQIQYSVLDVS